MQSWMGDIEVVPSDSIVIERLQGRHEDVCCKSLWHPEVWRYLCEPWKALVSNGRRGVFSLYLDGSHARNRVSFAVMHDGQMIGIVDLKAITEKTADITTILGKRWFGSGKNAETKLAVLQGFFDSGGQVVRFEVDSQNQRSLGAVRKMGLPLLAVLDSHWSRGGITANVHLFEVSVESWPEVRQRLVAHLSSSGSSRRRC